MCAGFEAIMPHRIDALPLIEAALRKLQAIPAAERASASAISWPMILSPLCPVAYCDLTGKRRGLLLG